jgi:hypothetical protein
VATFGGLPSADVRRHGADEDQQLELTSAPVWFQYLIVAGGCGVLGFGGIGLLLAVAGHFSVPLALAVGGGATVAGIVVGRPRRIGLTAPSAGTTLPAVAMCAVAGAIAFWNSVFIGHHVVVNNDPGVYAATGRWLADHNSLIVDAGAPWSHTGLNLNFQSAGIYGGRGGTVEFQFVHLSPTLLAEAYRIGGAGFMFRIPALLGALGLGAIYMVGCRLISRPWVVVAAVTALGISLPELSVTRDTFSEPSTQVLLWLGIWLLMRTYEERRVPLAFLAGFAVGGTLMTHIDAVVYLVPLPLLGALFWLTAKSSSERRSLLRLFAATLIGLVPPAVLGTFDVQRRAGRYYSDLRPQVVSLYHSLALATAVAVVILIVWPTIRPLRHWLTSRRGAIAVVAGWIVAAGLLLAWSLRPAGPKAFGANNPITAGLQKADNLPIQPGRTYAELSVRWMEWYLGPVALALAIAGLCFLTVRVISRGSSRYLVYLVMTGPVTAIYLWNPAITPYQIWALRRFVPAALPLLVLAAAVMLDVAVTFCVSRFGASAWPRRALVIGMSGLIAFPLGATMPVRSFQPQNDDLGLIDTTCRTIGPHAAVLFSPRDFDAVELMQTMRSWCNVPAGELRSALTQTQLATTVAGLRTEGRTLWVMAASAKAITSSVPGAAPHLLGFALNDREIQGTLTQPASTYGANAIAIYGARFGVS